MLITQEDTRKYFRVQVDDITPNNINVFKKIHAVLFPITYKDSFYADALSSGEYSKLGYFNDIPVGEICSRNDGPDSVYLLTLGVLAPYRKYGLGSKLLQHLIDTAKADGVARLYLHVQTDNQLARTFYEKRGFVVEETVEGYYKDLPVSSAWRLSLNLQ